MKQISAIIYSAILSISAVSHATASTELPEIIADKIEFQVEVAGKECAPMSLNDCLLYARQNARTNRLNRLKTETAHADKRIAAADLMPYLSLSGSTSLSFGRNIDPETNTYDNKKTLGSALGINLSLPLFDGLVSINNLKTARIEELRSHKNYLVEEDKISLEVIKNFYNVAYCRALVQQMERQLTRDSTDLAATRRGEELGTKSGADVAELEAVVASDLYELTNQKNLLKKGYLDLRGSMGMPLYEEPMNLIFDTLDNQDLSDYAGLSTMPDRRSKLPEIEDAELAVRASRYSLYAARGAYSPRLTLTGGISSSYYRLVGKGTIAESFRSQFRNNMGEYIGLSLSFPIFDGLATTNRVKRAQVALRESVTRLEEAEYQIRKASDEALLDRDAAIEELTAAHRRLEAEEIAYKAVRRKYELGMASAIDLYTAGSKLATAEATLTGKRIQRVISEITLRYYQGVPLIKE